MFLLVSVWLLVSDGFWFLLVSGFCVRLTAFWFLVVSCLASGGFCFLVGSLFLWFHVSCCVRLSLAYIGFWLFLASCEFIFFSGCHSPMLLLFQMVYGLFPLLAVSCFCLFLVVSGCLWFLVPVGFWWRLAVSCFLWFLVWRLGFWFLAVS